MGMAPRARVRSLTTAVAADPICAATLLTALRTQTLVIGALYHTHFVLNPSRDNSNSDSGNAGEGAGRQGGEQ